MKKVLSLILGLVLIAGCASNDRPEPIVETQTVKVPVKSEAPKPPKVTMPELPIYNLEQSSTPKEVAEAYAVSIAILKIELGYRALLLDIYRDEGSE